MCFVQFCMPHVLMAFTCDINVSSSCGEHSSSSRQTFTGVWLVDKVDHYFQQLLTCSLTGSAGAALQIHRHYLSGEDKELGCAVWVGGIWYLQKRGDMEGYFGGEMAFAVLLQLRETFSRSRKEKDNLSRSRRVWSYTAVCIIPKGQRSFPDWCEVSGTSFPPRTGTILHTQLSVAFLFLISHSRNNQ